MAWLILVGSGLLEAVWANALDRCDGFTNIPAVAVFLVATVLSMAGLATALKTLPVGTAYAVWVGIGAAATCVYAMATGAESVSLVKIALFIGIIACVAGLKLVSEG